MTSTYLFSRKHFSLRMAAVVLGLALSLSASAQRVQNSDYRTCAYIQKDGRIQNQAMPKGIAK
ncbi:hypothetical protein [Prevotella ihumii]|uniref:hypothetical protein n=1 Tax=Prevotella ihumii TaxID=1917878 RepID=UPI0009808DED|nr:hypothetical protein [Prevotella ihumii]